MDFKKFINSTTKFFIWWLMIEGTVWISCSYFLAFIGREQIAEALSQNVCQIVLGGLIAYVVSAAVSNIFQKNNGGIFGTSIDSIQDAEG